MWGCHTAEKASNIMAISNLTRTHTYTSLQDLERNPMVYVSRHGIGSRHECKTRPSCARHDERETNAETAGMAGYTKRENIIETFLSNGSHSSLQAAAEKRSRYSTGEYLCAVLRRHNAHHCIVLYAGPILDISEN